MLDEPSHDARMKVATIIARVLLGLIFVVFGFKHFLTLHSDAAAASGIAWRLHEVPFPEPLSSLRRHLPNRRRLASCLSDVSSLSVWFCLAPVIVNIDLVHILMDPSGLPMAAVISILLVFLIWRYRAAFKGILSP